MQNQFLVQIIAFILLILSIPVR